jgi:hypothetical protein
MDEVMAIEMTEYSDRDRAFHEAGHAVLAAQFGVEIERVSIVPIPEARSHVKLPAHPGLSPAEEVVVQLAGEEAQRRLDSAEWVMPNDRVRAQQLLAAAGIDEAQGRQMFTDGRERAHRLLADAGTWRRVEAVATALFAEGTLDGRRFRDIMAGA